MSMLACLNFFFKFERVIGHCKDMAIFKITVVRYLIFEKLKFSSINCVQSGSAHHTVKFRA